MVERKDRVLYLDISRGLAILFMFTQHCMLIHETEAGESEHLLSLVFTLLGTAPAAPVFMILMGIFQMRSLSSLKKQILRGVKLFALGLFLNLLRLPMMIAEGEGGSILFVETLYNILVFNDILQLAGLSYILGALIRPLMSRRFLPPFFILAVLLISPSLWGLSPGNPVLLMLWGTGDRINFPLFPWMAYPLLGMYLSPLLLKGGRPDGGLPLSSGESKNSGPDKDLTRLALTGCGLIVAGELLIFFRLLPVGDYSRSGPGVHLLITGFVFIWLKLCRVLELSFRPENAVFRLLSFLSLHITKVYFIQWILFAWSILPLGANQLGPYAAAAAGIAVFLLTLALLHFKAVRRLFSFTRV